MPDSQRRTARDLRPQTQSPNRLATFLAHLILNESTFFAKIGPVPATGLPLTFAPPQARLSLFLPDKPRSRKRRRQAILNDFRRLNRISTLVAARPDAPSSNAFSWAAHSQSQANQPRPMAAVPLENCRNPFDISFLTSIKLRTLHLQGKFVWAKPEPRHVTRRRRRAMAE